MTALLMNNITTPTLLSPTTTNTMDSRTVLTPTIANYMLTSGSNKRSLGEGSDTINLPNKKLRLDASNSDDKTQQSSMQSSKKRVRFANNDSLVVQQTVHMVPLVPDADRDLVWYNSEEYHVQRSGDFRLSHYYSKCEDDTYRNDLFQVLGAACGKLDHSKVTLTASLALSSSPIRGLERETTVCFRQRKKSVVLNVLKSQASLKRWKRINTSDDADSYASRVLALHYKKLAAPAGLFAQFLGEGDTQFVDKNVRGQ